MRAKSLKLFTLIFAIANLHENVEMLMKKQDFLEKKIDAEMVTARKVRISILYP